MNTPVSNFRLTEADKRLIEKIRRKLSPGGYASATDAIRYALELAAK